MQMPDINKRFEGLYIPMELAARLNRASIERKVTKTDIVIAALQMELARVQLTSDDYDWISAEVRKNELKRNRRTTANQIKEGLK